MAFCLTNLGLYNLLVIYYLQIKEKRKEGMNNNASATGAPKKDCGS